MTLLEDYFRIYREYEGKFPCAAANGTLAVIMEVGSFYEMYATDEPKQGADLGDVCSRLSILRTRKDKKSAVPEAAVTQANPYMAGFTSPSLGKYLAILLREGFTVAQIDQTTPPPMPRREVTVVHSPSTAEVSDSDESPELLCIVAESSGSSLICGAARLDLTTGRIRLHEPGEIEKLRPWVASSSPREVLLFTDTPATGQHVSDGLPHGAVAVHRHFLKDHPRCRRPEVQNDYLREIYTSVGPLSPLESFGLERSPLAAEALVHALRFVEAHDPSLLTSPSHPQIDSPECSVHLDRNALFDMRIAPRGDGKPCLLTTVDGTLTPMGRRELRERICAPLRDVETIDRRLDLACAVLPHLRVVRSSLKGTHDVERLQRQWQTRKITPTRFAVLLDAYRRIEDLGKDLDLPLLRKAANAAGRFRAAALLHVLPEKMGVSNWSDLKESFLLPRYSMAHELQERLDAVVDEMTGVREAVSTAVGAPVNLRHYDRYGWVLTTTKKRARTFLTSDARRGSWTSQATGNVARLVGKKLSAAGVLRAGILQRLREVVRTEYKALLVLLEELAGDTPKLVVETIRALDVAQSSAKLMVDFVYARPSFSRGGPRLVARGLRHPMVERHCTTESYVPHDLLLGADGPSGICLFAPNAAGKSTLMMAVGLATVLAHAGMPVPASSFELSVADAIYTRVNSLDSVGVSSFVAEMRQIKSIVCGATRDSLVLSDEACNMTESVSGLSISSAVLSHLVGLGSRFVFSSHLHELVDVPEVAELQPALKFCHLGVAVDRTRGVIRYLRDLRDGTGETVYGLLVARHMMPSSPGFWSVADRVRVRLEGRGRIKSSRYNAKVLIKSCQICGAPANQTHHIKFQQTAKGGFHGHVRVHAGSNLVGLCEGCHGELHRGEIRVVGWAQETKGRVLVWNRTDQAPGGAASEELAGRRA